MIFKTITTDLNGAINKFGIFNRSFADLKNAISANGIHGLFNSISPTITSKDLSNINEYNRLVSVDGVSSQTAWYRTMLSSSKAAQSLFDDEKNLIRTNNGLIVSEEAISEATKTMTLSAKAASIGLKALSIVGNMLLIWGITEVITKTASAINDYANSAEIAKEKAEALSSSLSESQSKYAEDSKKISELSEKYETLSKGVNHLGQNVSLSSTQYDEYKSAVDNTFAYRKRATKHRTLITLFVYAK